MKKIFSAAVALLLMLSLLSGCSGADVTEPAPAEKTEKLSVVASIFPQYDFVKTIAGDAVELQMLIPPGADSHSYDPSPQDIIAIQNCDVFIYVGSQSDTWLEELLHSIDTKDITMLALMDMVTTKEELLVEGMEHNHQHHDDEEHHDEHDDHEHDDHEHDDHHHEDEHDHEDEHHHDENHEHHLDEHVWTSPKNAIAIVQHLAKALGEQDSDNAEVYQSNAASYIEQLKKLDADYEDVVAAGNRSTIVVADRFPFRYFADDYGLDYYAAFSGCSAEADPSASTVAFLVDKVKDEQIPAVFYIESSNQKLADTVCSETGCKKLLLHSCHNVTQKEMDDGTSYLSLMQENLEALKEALQ